MCKSGTKLGIALLVLLTSTLLACGGETLTREQYAEQCGILTGERPKANDVRIILTAARVISAGHYQQEDMEKAEQTLVDWENGLESLSNLKPPSNMKLHHDALLNYLDYMDQAYVPLAKESISLAWEYIEDHPPRDGSDETIEWRRDYRSKADSLSGRDDYWNALIHYEDYEDAVDSASKEDQELLESTGCDRWDSP